MKKKNGITHIYGGGYNYLKIDLHIIFLIKIIYNNDN